MRTMNYYERLNNMHNAFSDRSGYSDLRLRIDAGLDKKSMGTLLQSNACTIDESILQFYREVNKFEFTWFVNLENEPDIPALDVELDIVMGEMNIFSLEDMLQGAKAKTGIDYLRHYSRLYEKNLIPELEFFRPFDGTLSDYVIGFIEQDGHLHDHLYAVYFGEGRLLDLNMSVDTYIAYSERYLAYHHWHWALLEENEEMRRQMRHYLPLLFPNWVLKQKGLDNLFNPL